MKKYLLIVFSILAILSASCSTSRGNKKTAEAQALPPYSELFTTLDSIIQEGWNLYYSERSNWIASDLVVEKYRAEEIGGYISWLSEDSVQCVFFFDKEEKNCLLEFKYDKKTNKASKVDSIRPLTDEEITKKQRQETMLNTAMKKYGENIHFAERSFGSPNLDVIRINDKVTRLYFMQGTIHPDVIPFGNDYSVDFDENLQPIAFRRYHNSLIAIQTKNEDGSVVISNIHSHLKDNPFITPTDICNFLLYHPENMDMFMVYSTAFNCRFAYSAKTNQIITVTE
ncbi:MAG: hypothetical protein IK005_06005 [Paludibacteraceae bacterium]|nr:hypothetical protein [Paludibacteraceae bacterium]